MAASASENKKRKMKSNSYGDAMIRSMSQLRENDELCDFTVSAEGQSFRVHKILLAATSDYFRAMLQGPMKESQEDRVDLKGLTADALQMTLNFIYSGELELDWDNLLEVLNAASHLQVDTALDLCSDYMITLLTFYNAEELLSIADTYSLSKVKDFYEAKVLDNFEEFSNTEQFLRLNGQQLARFLADDRLRIRSEHILFEIIAKWYSHGKTDRVEGGSPPNRGSREGVEEAVRCVRFCLLSKQQLSVLKNHWFTHKVNSAKECISQALKYHSDAERGHPVLSTQTKLRSLYQSLVLVHQDAAYRPLEITAYDHKENSFYQLASDISSSRDCRITALNDFIYICRLVDCGGGTLLNSLLRFDLRHLSLQELTPCSRQRIDPALLSKGQWLYIFGGATENYAILDSVECYDIHSNTWMELRPLPQATHSLAGTVCGDLIYLCGGVVVGHEQPQPTAALFCYDPNTQVWHTKAPMHCPRRLHEMTTLGTKRIYVLGGIGSHTFHQNTQIPIEEYSLETNQWTMLTATLAGRSIGHFIAWQGNILSLGREHQQATEEDIWMYEVKKDGWRPFIKAPRRMGLASASCTLLNVNFFDEKVHKRLITDRR